MKSIRDKVWGMKTVEMKAKTPITSTTSPAKILEIRQAREIMKGNYPVMPIPEVEPTMTTDGLKALKKTLNPLTRIIKLLPDTIRHHMAWNNQTLIRSIKRNKMLKERNHELELLNSPQFGWRKEKMGCGQL